MSKCGLMHSAKINSEWCNIAIVVFVKSMRVCNCNLKVDRTHACGCAIAILKWIEHIAEPCDIVPVIDYS